MDNFGRQSVGRIEADIRVERVDDTANSAIEMISEPDGVLVIRSTGNLPKMPLGQLRRLRKFLSAVVAATGQSISIESNGKQLVRVSSGATGKPKWSIHWWSALKAWAIG